jgi:periplasmic protein TonB
MSEDEEGKNKVPWVLVVAVIALVGGGVYIIKHVLSEDEPRRKNTTATVTLLKPPPVVIKEKPPEPEPMKEVQKKDDFVDPGPQNEQQDSDSAPAGDELGVDAEGGAGGDSFGLKAKKGGRGLLEGGDGMGKMSLLSKYAGYSQIAQNLLKKKVLKRLDEDGGIPKGKVETTVSLTLNSNGDVVRAKIIGSSGNHRMDDAVMLEAGNMRLNEPPPEGMPRTMKIKITSQG